MHRNANRPPQQQGLWPRSKRCAGPGNGRLHESRSNWAPTASPLPVERSRESCGTWDCRRFIDPNGETNRKPQVIVAKRPGQIVHVDVKKVGKIPDGGGWRAHGRGSDKAQRSQRQKPKNKQARIGYTYLHSAIDGNTRLAYTEARDNETAATAIDFMNNARLFFPAPRHHPNRARDHRQRIMLSGSRFHRFTPRSSALPHQAVHTETQRESRTLQPHPRRRTAVLPRVHQRSRAAHCHRNLVPLYLSSGSEGFSRCGSNAPFFICEHDSPQICSEVAFKCAGS